MNKLKNILHIDWLCCDMIQWHLVNMRAVDKVSLYLARYFSTFLLSVSTGRNISAIVHFHAFLFGHRYKHKQIFNKTKSVLSIVCVIYVFVSLFVIWFRLSMWSLFAFDHQYNTHNSHLIVSDPFNHFSLFCIRQFITTLDRCLLLSNGLPSV